MTHPRPHEYPYPFNAWITQVLPLRDFAAAFIKSTRDLRRANPDQWLEIRKNQYGMLMDMVHGFSLPYDTAEQIWQSVEEPSQYSSAYSTMSSEQIGLSEIPSDRLRQLSDAAHHARSASFQHSSSKPQVQIQYDSSDVALDSRPRTQFSPPKQEKLINQSKIAQQIEKQKQQAALREARSTGKSIPQTSKAEAAQPSIQKPAPKHQPQPKAAAPQPTPRKVAPAAKPPVDRISENIAKLKAQKAADQSKKAFYSPDENENLVSTQNQYSSAPKQHEFNSFSAQDNDDYIVQHSNPAPRPQARSTGQSTIKNRSMNASKIKAGRQTPMPVAQPKSRKGLFFAIFLLICVNAALVAYFVLPQFNIKNPLSFLTGKESASKSQESTDLNDALDEFKSRNAPIETSSTSAPKADEKIATVQETAAELESERAAIAARIEAGTTQPAPTSQANVQQQAAPQIAASPVAPQANTEQNSQQLQRQALDVLSKLRTQAADFNIEPETDAESALGYLKSLNELEPTPQMLIEAHRALEKGYLAMSKLAKAKGQDVDAQRMYNNSQNHASIADRYSQM